MTTLTINDMPVVLGSNNSFKLNVENPRFGEVGSWTFDITLPLQGCSENIRIFGNIHHAQCRKPLSSFSDLTFRLRADQIAIDGKVVVTGVTDDGVKVQLLGGVSWVTNTFKSADGEDRYIDEMELGRSWEDSLAELYAQMDAGGVPDPKNSSYMLSDNDAVLWYLNSQETDVIYHGLCSETDSVAFPIYSRADGKRANSHDVYDGKEGTLKYGFKGDFGEVPQGRIAAQPYLKTVVRRVLECLGFKLGEYELDGTWMEQIFVAHARNTFHIVDAIPHWTVEDFFKELWKLFGIYLDQDGDVVHVRLQRFRELPMVELNDVLDEQSCEDRDEDKNYIGNVSMAYDVDDPMLILPEEVWKNARILKFGRFDPAYSDFLEANKGLRAQSPWVFCVDDGDHVVYEAFLKSVSSLKWALCPVHLLPPFFPKEKRDDLGRLIVDTDETVKMVPCPMSGYIVTLYGNEELGVGLWVPILVTEETRINEGGYFSVDTAILNTENEQKGQLEKEDVMFLALNDGVRFVKEFTSGKEVEFIRPLGHAWMKDSSDGWYRRHESMGSEKCYWELDPHRDEENLHSLTRKGEFEVDFTTQYEFDFLDEMTDINRIFLIKGKRYLCSKIEYSLDNDGVKPLKKGFFYAIK